MMVHLLALNHGFMKGLTDPGPTRYATRVNGHLGHNPIDRLLRAPGYVPAILAQVEALGLDLVEVRQLGPECKSPESGDSRSPS